MSTVVFAIGLMVVAVGLFMGAAAAVTLFAGGARSMLRQVRGIQTEVQCPRTGRRTRVRLGPGTGDRRLQVFWCERFGDCELRCGAECVPERS